MPDILTLALARAYTDKQITDIQPYIDELVVVTTYSALPTTGSAEKIYLTTDTGVIYRWNNGYIAISAPIPTGGTQYQALLKASGNDFNISWQDISATHVTTNVSGKSLQDYIGTLSNLNTTTKTSVIAAINEVNTTMTGATASAAGVKGLVPTPAAGENEALLSGAGTYTKPNVANGYLQLDENALIPPAYIPYYNQTCWGAHFDGVNNEGTPLGDAKGMTFTPSVGTTAGTDDWTEIPIWAAQEVNMVASTGVINTVKGYPDFTYDGSNGEVMVRFPKGYYSLVKNADKSFDIWISDTKCEGFLNSPAHSRTGVIKDDIYIAKYKAFWDGTKLNSKSGVYPTSGMTRGTMRTRAAALGTGFCQYDIATHSWLEMLAHVKYKNLNVQRAVGDGLYSLPYAATDVVSVATTSANTIVVANAIASRFAVGLGVGLGTAQGNTSVFAMRKIESIETYDDNNKVITVDGTAFTTTVGNVLWCCGNYTGDCNNVPGTCGRAEYLIGTNSQVKMFNLESPWAERWTWEDGINTMFENETNQSYICINPANFADNTTGNYIKLGYTNSLTNGYIKEWGYDESAPWCRVCSVIDGDSVKPVGDYYYRSADTNRVSAVGGALNYGASCGLSLRDLYYSSGGANWRIVGRFQKVF